jgi:uncharacterized BrkB/YihY/UPF0761 family membrane protein
MKMQSPIFHNIARTVLKLLLSIVAFGIIALVFRFMMLFVGITAQATGGGTLDYYLVMLILIIFQALSVVSFICIIFMPMYWYVCRRNGKQWGKTCIQILAVTLVVAIIMASLDFYMVIQHASNIITIPMFAVSSLACIAMSIRQNQIEGNGSRTGH